MHAYEARIKWSNTSCRSGSWLSAMHRWNTIETWTVAVHASFNRLFGVDNLSVRAWPCMLIMTCYDFMVKSRSISAFGSLNILHTNVLYIMLCWSLIWLLIRHAYIPMHILLCTCISSLSHDFFCSSSSFFAHTLQTLHRSSPLRP